MVLETSELGGESSNGGTCFQAILFLLCALCPPAPLASGSTEDFPWLPTLPGNARVVIATVFPEALHCGPCTRPSSLSVHISYGCFSSQKPESFGRVHLQKAVLSTLPICLVPPHPQTHSLLMPQGQFLPLWITAGWIRLGLAQVVLLIPTASLMASTHWTQWMLLSEAQAQQRPAAA